MANVGVAGLTAEQVAERVATGRSNRTPRSTSRPIGEILRANLFTRFNAIIIALCVLVLVFGELPDALFGLIVVVNSGIGIVQELRARRVLDRLAVLGEEPVRVRRDGGELSVPPEEVVLDDVVLLAAGDRVPVDGQVLVTDQVEIDESLLTGESDPVHKAVDDAVLSGSFVVAGSAAVRATAVGQQGYAAELVAEASRFTVTRSELLSGIDKFLRYITWLIVPVGVLLVISQLASRQDFASAMVGSVAGVVPMIPEGLVLMTSIAFTVGVLRLSRRRCLVQELAAVEVLARVDVLCLDKTGTLTDAAMDLAELHVLVGDEPDARQVLAALVGTEARPNPTLQAIASNVGEPPSWAAVATVPFSSARKWSAAAFDGHGGWVLGAPDVLLAPADPHRADAERIAALGSRVLALAEVDPDRLAAPGQLGHVTATALVVLAQRLRPDAEQTLRYFAEQGVAVKVISGDNAASVGAVAGALHVPGADRPVDARDLPDDVGELAEILEHSSVFGRVGPQQKRTFVAALRSKGHVVAMTGDGVNDVLALKDADLGVAMGSGSGATRSVARIVLLDDNFAVLPSVVAEGRRVLGNIERVANLFLTKTFYSVVLALAVGVARLPFPFLPRHVTLIGALTIGIPGFFLALAPNTRRARPGFVPRVLRFAIPAGVICAVATFAAYWLARSSGTTSLPADRSTATLALFLVAVWALALVARPYTWWRAGLVAVMVLAFVVTVAIPFTRHFFALGFANTVNDLVAFGIGVAGAAVLTVFVLLTPEQ
ncbi:MAG TPA: HAD-IC family P-type ATPase [Pseudonocardiaceae bacterium]